jgi:hypothetical protein
MTSSLSSEFIRQAVLAAVWTFAMCCLSLWHRKAHTAGCLSHGDNRTVWIATCRLKHLTRSNSCCYQQPLQKLYRLYTVMSWTGHVARTGKKYKENIGRKPWIKVYLEYLVADGRMILKLIVVEWADFAQNRDKWQVFVSLWVPVTTAWRVLRLWMEERAAIRRVAANIVNK